jgi:hypothetical protein
MALEGVIQSTLYEVDVRSSLFPRRRASLCRFRRSFCWTGRKLCCTIRSGGTVVLDFYFFPMEGLKS